MKYKMIVSDYDNTICNNKKVVTPRTRAAIKRYTENGGRFVICTTRPYIGIVDLAKDLGLKDEVIANQGATVRNLSDDSVVFQSLFSYEEAKEILEYFEEKSSHVFISSDFISKSKSHDLFVRICERTSQFSIKKTTTTLYEDCKHLDIAQIIVGLYNPRKVIELAHLAKTDLGDKYEIGVCDKFLLNLTQKDVSKGHAIQRIAEIHDIKKEEIVAIGDSLNDSPMFEFAGLGVAMGNSMKGLKMSADTVCGDVKDDGLAEFMERYCL